MDFCVYVFAFIGAVTVALLALIGGLSILDELRLL